MEKLELRPIISKNDNGTFKATAGLHEEGGMPIAIELFGNYKTKKEAWEKANTKAKEFANNHNKNCNCGKKMTVGTY